MKDIKGLFYYIKGLDDSCKLNHSGFTGCELFTMKSCFNDLHSTGQCEFIQQNIAAVFKKYGFDVTEKGIGFQAR